MKVKDAIAYADGLKPNQHTQENKIRWLNTLDVKIVREVIMTHWQPEDDAWTPEDIEEGVIYDWTATGDDLAEVLDTELVVPEPWATDVYNNYLQMMIDKENGETAKYNNSRAHFTEAFTDYTADYNRSHLPIKRARMRF